LRYLRAWICKEGETTKGTTPLPAVLKAILLGVIIPSNYEFFKFFRKSFIKRNGTQLVENKQLANLG